MKQMQLLILSLINVCRNWYRFYDTGVAINGGEDYELLFTIAMEDFEKLKEIPFIIEGDTGRKWRNPFNYSSDTKILKGVWLMLWQNSQKKGIIIALFLSFCGALKQHS
jgi:hypothetical protein